jgi:hypothetical protein
VVPTLVDCKLVHWIKAVAVEDGFPTPVYDSHLVAVANFAVTLPFGTATQNNHKPSRQHENSVRVAMGDY